MFKYNKELKICEIGNIKVGKNNSPLLIGTIFYAGQKIRKGGIDFEKAKEMIHEVIDLSDKTKINFMLDIYIEKGDDIPKMIDFISGFDIPFLMDAGEWEVRMKTLEHCNEVGLIDKVLYNSINFSMTEDERELIKEIKPKNAILLAFNPIDNSVEGKVHYIKNKLYPFSKVAGVKNVLIDSGVMTIGNGSLNSIKALVALKSELGLPVGNGIHNIISDWVQKIDKSVREICDSSLAASQLILGIDFLLYGPIESSWRIFPVAQMISEILKDE